MNKNEVVILVKTVDNTEEAIKNAPKIDYWSMLSVNTMYTWIEKYNLGSIVGAKIIDVLEKLFSFNLKLMINGRLKNRSLKQIDFMDFSFDGLHYTFKESMSSSTTSNYFSNNNTAD